MDDFYENRRDLMDDALPISVYVNRDLTFRAHWHEAFELVYVESGSLDISINNNRRKLVQGQIALCPGGQIHYYETTDSHNQSLLLIFKPEYFGLEINWPHSISFDSPYVTENDVDPSVLQQIRRLLLAMLEEKTNKTPHYELMLRSHLTLLCATLLRNVPNETIPVPLRSGTPFGLIHNILDYIEHHYMEPITLRDLAKTFNVDYFNLSKKFNQMTGSSFKTHIHTLRIAKAEQLILTTDMSLLEIAMACGFESVRTFNRTFKKIKNMTPSQVSNLHDDLV